MSQEIPFEPFSFFTDPHHQTIISSMFNFLSEPVSIRKTVLLPDGDQLAYEVTTPPGWKETDGTVLLVHGLCGSHRSPNLIRMVNRLEPKGIRCVRYNMRGCGSGRGLSQKLYHSGRSEDVFSVLKALKTEHPDSPITLIGFSLGGNLVLKLAGELHTLADQYLEKVIAVSPPVDLHSSVQMLGQPENGIYERYFYKLLRADVHDRQRLFKGLPRIRLPRNLKLYEFDQLYTAPAAGFSDVIDYYDKCSSSAVVENIAIPCRILLSEDDPIISPHSLDSFNLPPNIEVFKTKKGGHMGYLASPTDEKGFYWLDSLLVDWVLGEK
jgi:hypothetical protein